LIPVKSGKEIQYIDRQGKIVINPQFKDATVFRDGLALVLTSGDDRLFGYINEEGKYVINAKYKEATVFSEGLAWVVADNDAPSAINKKGDIKFTLTEAEKVRTFHDGLAAFSVLNEDGEEHWGFVNKEGNIVINAQFSDVSNFSEGKCSVRNSDGKWGYIESDGQISINYQFDRAGDFKNGRCVVASGGKKGAIDSDGKYIINPQFSEMVADGDLFMINQGGKYGWCDLEGAFVINPQFEAAFPFNGNSLTPFESGNGFGYINKEGKIIINPQFRVALPFNGDLALVATGGKTAGFIDIEGKYVINPQFDGIPDDLLAYLVDGSSSYSSVNTDYFNIGAITSAVDISSPEGFTFSSTYDDVLRKYDIDESTLYKYRSQHRVSTQQITPDASYNFYVLGEAFRMDTVRKKGFYGDYYDTELVFDGKLKPSGYMYEINLSGRGVGKSSDIVAALNSTLQGRLDGNTNTEGDHIYYDGTKMIAISEINGRVIVSITNEIDPDVGYDEEPY